MTRIQDNVFVKEDGSTDIRYLYEGEESEKTAFLAAGNTMQENEKWFCPDSGKTYYWSKASSTLKEIGYTAT